MTAEPLPEYLIPHRLARHGARFAGELPTAVFERFSAELLDSSGSVNVTLKLFRDDEYRTCVAGTLCTTVRLTCQRCLEPVELAVECEMSLAVVGDDEAAANLPQAYEPLVLDGERISLIDLIEDDLLLGLPVTPRHAADACEAPPVPEAAEPDASEDAPDETEKPFSQLRVLRDDS